MEETEQQKYRVIFNGEIEPDQNLGEVKERLSQLFKTSPERIDKLFIGKSTTLNHSLEYTAAQDYLAELKQAGILCEIEPMPAAAVPETNPPTVPKSSSSPAVPLPSQKSAGQTKKTASPSLFTRLYTAGWLLTAAGSVILFAAYILFILLIVSTTYGFIEDNTFLLDDLPIGIGFLAYLLPILAGLMFIGALLKPFLAPPVKKRFSIPIMKKREQALYNFVEKLCRSLGSKKPTVIEVDCDIHTSASYRRDLISFLEDDLTLTIGLPVISEMTLSDFASLLGHEFGHYTDKTGTRLYYIITSVNAWFHRAVFDEDVIDQKMGIWTQTASRLLYRAFFTVVLGFIWAARKVLTGFMLTGQAFSKFYTRQMEFEADKVALSLAGTNAFESSLHRLRTLGIASNEAFEQLRKQKNTSDNSMPKDFVRLVSILFRRMKDEDISKIRDEVMRSASNILAAHPGDRERIEEAKRIQAQGVFQSDKPASSLFANLDEIARLASLRLYREGLGLRFNEKELVPTDEFMNLPEQGSETAQSESEPNMF